MMSSGAVVTATTTAAGGGTNGSFLGSWTQPATLTLGMNSPVMVVTSCQETCMVPGVTRPPPVAPPLLSMAVHLRVRAHRVSMQAVRWAAAVAVVAAELLLSLLLLGTLTSPAPEPADQEGAGAGAGAAERQKHAARMRQRRAAPDPNGARKSATIKGAAAAGRIAVLEQLRASRTISKPQHAELLGLLKGGDTYDSSTFTPEHLAFKAAHNDVLVALTAYCRAGGGGTAPKVFVLDGADGLSTAALRRAGHAASCCYVANRHEGTVRCLVAGGLPAANVAHTSGLDALTCGHGAFGGDAFTAIYLDACGLSPKPLMDMVEAALKRERLPPRIALGFSLIGGGRAGFMEREREVVRAAVRMAALQNPPMRVSRAEDDPERYGMDPETAKSCDGTLTAWLILHGEHDHGSVRHGTAVRGNRSGE